MPRQRVHASHRLMPRRSAAIPSPALQALAKRQIIIPSRRGPRTAQPLSPNPHGLRNGSEDPPITGRRAVMPHSVVQGAIQMQQRQAQPRRAGKPRRHLDNVHRHRRKPLRRPARQPHGHAAAIAVAKQVEAACIRGIVSLQRVKHPQQKPHIIAACSPGAAVALPALRRTRILEPLRRAMQLPLGPGREVASLVIPRGRQKQLRPRLLPQPAHKVRPLRIHRHIPAVLRMPVELIRSLKPSRSGPIPMQPHHHRQRLVRGNAFGPEHKPLPLNPLMQQTMPRHPASLACRARRAQPRQQQAYADEHSTGSARTHGF